MTKEQIVKQIRQGQGGLSLRQYAKLLGISAAYLSDVYNGRRDPGPSVLGRIGFSKMTRKQTWYVKNGRTA